MTPRGCEINKNTALKLSGKYYTSISREGKKMKKNDLMV